MARRVAPIFQPERADALAPKILIGIARAKRGLTRALEAIGTAVIDPLLQHPVASVRVGLIVNLDCVPVSW